MDTEARAKAFKRLLLATGLFDADFYLSCYGDVKAAVVDPYEHFLNHGIAELRDPCATFSSSGYQLRYPDVVTSGMSAIEHYLFIGRELGRESCPIFPGFEPFKAGKPTILLAGHQAEDQLFGAELSLVDLATAFTLLNYNVVISLPTAKNANYVAQLAKTCLAVVILPQSWWVRDRALQLGVVQQFTWLMQHFNVSAIHLNTLVHYEAAVAARTIQLPVVIHVRELPVIDEALCARLQATPAQVMQHIMVLADYIVANSYFTASFFDGMPCSVVYNSCHAMLPSQADATVCNVYPDVVFATDKPLVVGMLSSNLPKKGLDDFIVIARKINSLGCNMRFRIIGPDNSHIAHYKQLQQATAAACNIEFVNYTSEVSAQISALDVVMNLSSFQESFGRSVLEAMLAKKIVVAYRWGALPELITHGVTGFLVPFQDTNAVVDCLLRLDKERDRMPSIANVAASEAQRRFSINVTVKQLEELYDGVWSLKHAKAI
ncbi:glycosyltransferase family 4 protein [Alishewanella longhuensis]